MAKPTTTNFTEDNTFDCTTAHARMTPTGKVYKDYPIQVMNFVNGRLVSAVLWNEKLEQMLEVPASWITEIK